MSASNTSLRKQATKLGDLKKELLAKVVELKFRNEELEDKNVELERDNAMLKGQVDSLKKELSNSDVESVAAKIELESTMKKMKFIVVDATLNAQAELTC